MTFLYVAQESTNYAKFSSLAISSLHGKTLVGKEREHQVPLSEKQVSTEIMFSFSPYIVPQRRAGSSGGNSVNWLRAWLSRNCEADPLQLQKWLMKYQTHRSRAWWVRDILGEFQLSNQPLGLGVHLTRKPTVLLTLAMSNRAGQWPAMSNSWPSSCTHALLFRSLFKPKILFHNKNAERINLKYDEQ